MVVFLDPSKLFPECAVAFLSFGFFVATVAYPLRDDTTRRSTFLIVYLVLVSILSGSAGLMRFIADRSIKSGTINGMTRKWAGVVKSFLQPSRNTFIFLHGSACILHLYLIARLYAVDNFQTHPTNLDFGPKYGYIDKSDGSFEPNIAFEAEFNSFGHSLQGFLPGLLGFPAVSGWIARKIGGIGMGGSVHPGRARVSLSVTTLLYSILTIYPTYNLIKRLIKDGEVFASTSFVNNAFEWTMGYVLGMSLGMLLTCVMRKYLVIVAPSEYEGGLDAFMRSFDVSHNNEPKYAFGKLEEYVWTPPSDTCLDNCRAALLEVVHMNCFAIVAAISNIFLALFTVCVLLAGIFFGATWNNCREDDGDDCINSVENGIELGDKLILAFVLTFMATLMVFAGVIIRMKGPLI